MIEGWHGDDYLQLFDDAEASAFSTRYDLDRFLPGYRLVGLRGWDDFIVKDANGRLATVPTVPLSVKHLTPLDIAVDASRMEPDDRFRGKVKWYLTPLLFGGSPTDKQNLVWVTLERHAELVRFWNDHYRRLK